MSLFFMSGRIGCGCLLWIVMLSHTAVAQEVYHWTDEAGVDHYSDQPHPDAERITLEPATIVDFNTPDVPVIAPDTTPGEDFQDRTYEVTLVNHEDEGTVWRDDRTLELLFDIEPPLAIERGHRLVVYIDGEPRTSPSISSQFLLHDIDRGSHRISAHIVDDQGQRLAASEPITIHHRQHSLGTGATGQESSGNR